MENDTSQVDYGYEPPKKPVNASPNLAQAAILTAAFAICLAATPPAQSQPQTGQASGAATSQAPKIAPSSTAPSAKEAGSTPACKAAFLSGKAPESSRPALAKQATLVCHASYAAMVSGITKGPLWSIEHLTPERAAAADTLGGKAAFHDEDAVPPADRPSIADYTGSGMDKGALAPTADGGTIPEREERASMANVVPMSPGLARGMWHAIEASVRTLARSGNGIWVVTGPAFHGDKVTEFGTSKIIEPTAIWKAIYDPTRGATGVYVCTNVNFPTCNIFSVADLTRETGIDPFPSLAASAKATAMFLDRPTGGGYAEAP